MKSHSYGYFLFCLYVIPHETRLCKLKRRLQLFALPQVRVERSVCQDVERTHIHILYSYDGKLSTFTRYTRLEFDENKMPSPGRDLRRIAMLMPNKLQIVGTGILQPDTDALSDASRYVHGSLHWRRIENQ